MRKRIHTWKANKGRDFESTHSRAFIIGNHSDNIKELNEIVAELKRDFPTATDEEILFGKVKGHGSFDNHIFVSIAVPPNSTQKGYDNRGDVDFYFA